ncbi:MAG: MAPEG family protein, partial [Gammaproteobacteria bacterium]|nr:MAPEG family protein [Gemmatimonadota bacterium]NIU72490.1 MAPEG family protein [Gammaproteobacteria bacterium]
MTTELTYLTWTAVLCLVLWTPYIVAGTSRHGFLTAADYRIPGSRVLPPWADRAQRA